MRNASLKFFLALAVVVGIGYCQPCSPPTVSDLETVIAAIIQTGDASTVPNITIADFEVVCRAFSQKQDLLRGVSVVVQYTCSGHGNCPMGTATEQIESGCSTTGSWTNNVAGVTDPTHLRTTNPIATLSTPARDDCHSCFSQILAADFDFTTDNVTHCVACDSECNEGLMRCFSNGADDCCNFYNSGMCVAECPSPFVPNSANICVCPEGLTGSNCEIVVTCPELTPPLNGAIDSSNRTFNTVVTYSCSEGYMLTGDSTRTCLGTGVWSGSDPTCTVVDCSELVAPENGAVSTSSGTTFNLTATYSCNDGYTLEGVTTRTCLASVSWSDSAPTCTECSENCAECNLEMCVKCEAGYTLEKGICVCSVTGCDTCNSDTETCDKCNDGLRLNDAKTACVSGDDNGGGGGGGLSPGAIVGIILAIIVLAILLALLTALIIYLIKRYWDKVHLNKTELEAGPSTDHLNPLYVKPTDLDDVDRGAHSPTNGNAAFPSETVAPQGGGENGGPVSNGSE